MFSAFPSIFTESVTEGRNLYVSRASGNDSWSCDLSQPCKTIWRAVTLASREDHIHLDGTNTDTDPYTCESGRSDHPGIYVNKSLTLTGFGRPLPQIRCSNGTNLTFDGSNNELQMNVTLSRLFVKESFVIFQDSYVKVDDCEFEGSKKGLEFLVWSKKILNIQITNSNFSRNSKCISVFVNTQVLLELANSQFDEGGCISFTESPLNHQYTSCNITLVNVTFSRNKFNTRGIMCLEMDNGTQNINFQRVTFIDNSPLSSRDVSPGGNDSECIIRGSTVNILIDSSNFTSQSARSFNVGASYISLQIDNSRFVGHKVQGNGGVISMRGTNRCKLNVSGSSFVNTTAAQGGGINTQCADVCSVNFQDSSFRNSQAIRGIGGAVYINCSGYLLSDPGSKTNGKSEVDWNIRSSEQLLQMNISRCNFSKIYSQFDGGAVYVSTSKATMRLRHSAFTKCTAEDGVGGGVSIHVGMISTQNNKTGHDFLLSLDSSHFAECTSRAYGGGALNIKAVGARVEISINNSHFIFNYGGAFTVNSYRVWTQNAITIEQSTFLKNSISMFVGDGSILSVRASVLVLRKVLMESNRGGVVSGSHNFTLIIQQSQFLRNQGGVFYAEDVNFLSVQDSLFDGNNAIEMEPVCSLGTGTIFTIIPFPIKASILIANTTFSNYLTCLQGKAIAVMSLGNLTLRLKKSRFVNIKGTAIWLSLAEDTEKNRGCTPGGPVLTNRIDDAKEFPWGYRSRLLFEDITFERNLGYAGGAIYMQNGEATFRNCSFIDNFASFLGGHIFAGAGSTSLIIQDSMFLQTTNNLQFQNNIYSKTSFIHSESSGALKLYNTTMDARAYSSTSTLLYASNARLIDVGTNVPKPTVFDCPVGNKIDILELTEQVKTKVNNTSCTIHLWTLQVVSCLACGGDSYSLQRGHALGSRLAPGFQCLPCPFGANCSEYILAKPNFWGFKERVTTPTLRFIMCPLGYCRPPQEANFPEYNGCQGNRSGELCGHCNESYTESLYSTNCKPSQECNNYWFWPVAVVYVALLALYFTFKPIQMTWIKRQILWCKEHELTNKGSNFDAGYLKIVVNFYQAANLLLVSNSSQFIIKSKFIELLVGLFNFQPKVSSICPFDGLTAVTKRLFSAAYVFGTLLMIGVFYGWHCAVQKFRGQRTPSIGPYFAGILQTLLLGYTTLASVSFSLLRCVSIGSEKRLFYDGNIVCFQWWQYILIAFICTFFVPFVFVLLWGSFKLYRGTLSVGGFVFACFFPLPSVVHWSCICLFCKATSPSTEDSSPSHPSRNSVEAVLYGSFKTPEEGGKLSLSWESVMIGRRLILVVFMAFFSDPMPRLLIMSLFCVLFLHHHTLTHPFRDGIANLIETISLLSLVLLGMINMFLASSVSLAVTFSDHFTPWLNALERVQIVILCTFPAIFSLFVVSAVLSQLFRITAVVFRLLRYLFWTCFHWSRGRQDDTMRPLLATVT